MKPHHSDKARLLHARDAILLIFEFIEIAWREIIAMRHHLTHGYFQVEINDVWDTVDNDYSLC